MNAYHLPHLSLFRGFIIMRCVHFFLIFSLNYQQGVKRCCIRSTNEKRLRNQVYRQIKSKLVDTFGSGKSSPFEMVDFSTYRFLSSFSKFKQYYDSPQTFVVVEAGFGLTRLMFPSFFACQTLMHAC